MPRYAAAPFLAFAACLLAGLGHAADARVTVTWRGVTLRDAAARLTDMGGVAVVVDRRLDPDVRVSLDVADEPLSDVVARVAEAVGAEVARYAAHLRVVPRGLSAALAAADAERTAEWKALGRNLPPAVRSAAASSWPEGAVPRELIAALADDAGLAVTGLDDLPHDHLPSARLPPLSRGDRIDLLLAHFDRRVAWRRQAGPVRGKPIFTIVPIALVPGPPADNAAPPPRATQPASPTTAAARYTLTVAAPLDELLETLARRFALTLALDRAALTRAGVAPGEIVRLKVDDVSRDELLDAILAPLGLAWRIDAGTLSVSAAPR